MREPCTRVEAVPPERPRVAPPWYVPTSFYVCAIGGFFLLMAGPPWTWGGLLVIVAHVCGQVVGYHVGLDTERARADAHARHHASAKGRSQ